MQYLIGFVIGFIASSIVMYGFAAKFAGEAINKLMEELKKALE